MADTKKKQPVATSKPKLLTGASRHKGSSWEAVRSARKTFFNKISNS